MNNQSVVVLTPNGRRQTVKVDPNKTILEILEFAAQKHGFSADDYNLKHHNKILDLSQMFRYSGLPNNCTLEMVECDKKRVDTEIEVCLVLEDGSRKTAKFSSTSSLEEIVQQLCPDLANPEQNPLVIYMRKEVFGEDLKSTNLKKLGLSSGKAMFRFMNKNPEDLKHQANVSAPLPQKPKEEVEEQPRTRKVEPGSSTIVTPDVIKSLKTETVASEKSDKPEKMDVDDGEEAGQSNYKVEEKITEKSVEVAEEKVEEVEMPEPEIHMLDDRDTIIFSLESVETPTIGDLPDSFYELTETDVRKLYRDLRNQVTELQEAPLRTSEIRKLEEDKRILNQLSTYKKCVLRIQFPNRYVIQFKSSPVDKIEDVLKHVRTFLAKPEMEFYLYLTPPKTILDANLNLLEANCVPNALLHFGMDQELEGDLLKPELYGKLTTAFGASFAVSKFKSEMKRNVPGAAVAGPSGSSSKPRVPDNFMESKASSSQSGKLPKWFKTAK